MAWVLVGVETLGEGPADDARRCLAQELTGGRISLDHALSRRVDDEDGLRDHAEQQPVARLDLTETPVVALQRLLGVDELLLERSHPLEIASDRDDGAVVALESECPILDRNLSAARTAMRDLTPARDRLAPGLVEQGFEIGARVERDGRQPRLTDPVGVDIGAQILAAEGNVLDRPVRVEHDGDVGQPLDQRGRRSGIEGAETLTRGSERTHGHRTLHGHMGTASTLQARGISTARGSRWIPRRPSGASPAAMDMHLQFSLSFSSAQIPRARQGFHPRFRPAQLERIVIPYKE
jgi:hypothetical protein